MGGDLTAAAGGQVADVPGRGDEGSGRRQHRSHPDRQGLDGRARARCRRRSTTWCGRAIASPARTASCRRSATRSMSPMRPGPTPSVRPNLRQMWQDPDFDPALRAFYYVRVLEIPTPRWTAYDAKRFNVKMDKEVPMTTQERAYTSPIWYTPAKLGREARCASCYASRCCTSCCWALGCSCCMAGWSGPAGGSGDEHRHHPGTDRAARRRLRAHASARARWRASSRP